MLALPMSSAQAGAFSIYEQGARAMGRASAFAASPSDPSAMFYNPAGLAMLDGTQIYVGATLIAPSGEFEGSGELTGVTETQVSQLFPLPNVYISHRMNDKLVLGLGVSAPFGLGTEWEDPAAFSGRYLAWKTDIQALSINPTVAFSVSDQLSIGVGVDFRMMSKLSLNRYSFSDAGVAILDVATAELETDMSSAVGYNAGLLFKASDQITLGASYRAAVDMDYEGTATITQILTGKPTIDGAVAATVGDHDVATSIAYPSVTTFAIAFKATDQLLLEVDVNLTGWSVFEELVVTGLPTGTETIEEDYENSMTVRLGAEFWTDDTMALRAGFLYDETPVPNKSISPLLPDAKRTGFTFGVGKTFGSMTVDAAFMYLMFGDADTMGEHPVYNGVYKNSALLFGLNVGFAFGK